MLAYAILVLLGLAAQVHCDNDTNSTEDEPLWSRGLYGGLYYNPDGTNPDNIHYIHGTYQTPTKDYYKNRKYFRDEGPDETFDYYLGFALAQMTDTHFQYDDYQHYYHDINRTIEENETIASEFVIACHPNATSLCPENTETVCLLNGTIYCMSKISVVIPCPENETLECVQTVVPCVRSCIDLSFNFEQVVLPCLGTVVIVDVYEDQKGKTLAKVGGTFVIVNAIEQKERTFCVSVIVDPKPKLTDP